MARLFSIKPTLRMKGRKFHGLRGWAGKPLHPPLTDIPVTAYVLVAAFDLISFIAAEKGPDAGHWAHDFFRAGTFTIIAGGIVSLATALTGFWDWLRSTPPHTQAWRTANWHMAIMLTVTSLVVANIILRLNYWDDGRTTLPLMILSLVIGGLTAFGATYGGALVYEYGFNVETSSDSAVWHESERDLFHGDDMTPPGEREH